MLFRVVGGLAGFSHGATRRKPRVGDMVLKAGLGFGVGLAVDWMVPRAQEFVCVSCGCSGHLTDRAAA